MTVQKQQNFWPRSIQFLAELKISAAAPPQGSKEPFREALQYKVFGQGLLYNIKYFVLGQKGWEWQSGSLRGEQRVLLDYFI
jgi:hypothetical protein